MSNLPSPISAFTRATPVFNLDPILKPVPREVWQRQPTCRQGTPLGTARFPCWILFARLERRWRVAVAESAGETSKQRRNVPPTEQQGCAESRVGGHDVENDKGHHYLVAHRRRLRSRFHSRAAKRRSKRAEHERGESHRTPSIHRSASERRCR